MASEKSYTLTISDLRGGRNGCDPPLLIPDDQCLEALNVDWWEGSVANKRGGASAIGITFSAGGPFSGGIVSLIRHVPAGNEAAAEFWAADGSGQLARLAGAATWTEPTIKDAIVTPAEVHGASLGGILHLAYDSAVNRAQLWDGTSVRRAGLATPAAPTGATAGGSGLTFTRTYRVRWVEVSGSTTVRISEASATLTDSITDDSGYTVTRPTAASEGETHWDLEAADTTAGPFYRLARTAIGTTTATDSNATIPTTTPSAEDGINTPPPSWKYIGTDDNRIYGAGCWETSTGSLGATIVNDKRFWFTPVLGSSDIGDAERVPVGNYIGLEETPTAVSKRSFQGSVWVFAQSRIWKMVPTGVDTAPYQKFTIRGDIGCIHQQTLVEADDEDGGGALYFWTRKGPYRLGANGFQYCGADIEDISSTVNLAATTLPHGIYHADKHQIWWWLPVSGNVTPTVKVVFDTKAGKTVNVDEVRQQVRRGWAKHDGESAKAYCSCMFSGTLGASMSHLLKPYIGYVTSTAIWVLDGNATDDAGTTFRAYVDTKELGTPGRNHDVRQGVLIAPVASGVTITVQPISDFGLDTTGNVGTALLTAAASETRVQKRLEALQHAGFGTFRLRIGDAAAIANQWTVEVVQVNVTEQEVKS